jgi:chorismate mutase
MSLMRPLLGLTVPFIFVASSLGQGGGAVQEQPRVVPTGPAAKRADDLLRDYTERIEKEIEQGRKEVERLRADLHQLIDVRDSMSDAIGELRADLASKGIYSAEPVVGGQAGPQAQKAEPSQPQGITFRRDLIYGFGSAMPKEPSPQQREQLRRLAPRADIRRMVKRLREEVEETRADVDQMAYKLLELRAGIPSSYQGFGGMGGMGGGMGGMSGMGGMDGMNGPWFGSMGMQGVGGMM